MVEGDAAGGRGDDRQRAVLPPHHQGRQPLAFAVSLVGGKPLDVRGGQLRRVVAAAGRVDGQERAQLGGRAAEGVEGAAGARAGRGAQQVSQVVPQQVPQPPLGDAGQVEVAAPLGEPHPEVVGLDEARVPAGFRGEVGQPQVVQHLPGHHGRERGAGGKVKPGQRPGAAGPAGIDQGLHPAGIPPGVPFPLGMSEQAPADLRDRQRRQPGQDDLARPRHWRLGAAPGAELLPVSERDRHRQAPDLIAAGPGPRQRRAARPALRLVPGLVARAQAQRRGRQVRADRHLAGAVPVKRDLTGEPVLEAGLLPLAALAAIPAHVVPVTQPPAGVRRGPARADPARHLLHPDRGAQRLRGGEERGHALPAGLRLRLLLVMDIAHLEAALAGPLAASHQARPPEDRVPGRDADHPGAEQRVERRAVDQRGQQLQPVPPGPGAMLLPVERQQRVGFHRSWPHTRRNAASNAGSCTSAWA